MKITKLQLDGYKNVCDLSIDLSNITSFLSINNYGKSNVLSGIEFAIEFIAADKIKRVRMMQYTPNIPLVISDLGKNFKFEIEFDTAEDISVRYGIEFEWQSSRKRGGVLYEYLKIRPKGSQKFLSCVNRTAETSKYLPSQSGRCTKVINADRNELVIDKLSLIDDLFYIGIIEEIKNIKIFIDRHFDAQELFRDSPIIEKGQDDISPYNERSIARILFFLKKEYKDRYMLIENTLKDLFPYIVDIRIKAVKLSDKNIHAMIDKDAPFELVDYLYVLYVTNKNLAITLDFSTMSDGVKRVLSLLTYITLADINNIPLVAIEEPENSIHPGLLKKYMGIINGFLTSSKILITSHSPYLINYVNFESLYIGLPNESGRAEFGKISQSGINRINTYASELNLQAGDYLFSIMSSNDEFDKMALRKYLV